MKKALINIQKSLFYKKQFAFQLRSISTVEMVEGEDELPSFPYTKKSNISKRESLLFTPGPLTTSPTVKQSMLVDYGSRDPQMISIIKEIREKCLQLIGLSKQDGYECILIPGSGTYSIESVLTSIIPDDGKLLIISNGAYGKRMETIVKYAKIPYTLLDFNENDIPDSEVIKQTLEQDNKFTHVTMVHHETTVGILNPVEEIGALLHQKFPHLSFVVDSMSALGAYTLNCIDGHIHYIISSSNKNIEGVPGFGFVLCQRQRLLDEGIYARSYSLDLLDQWKGLEKNGQFRFTPPTHALIAFRQALKELEVEGGIHERYKRYCINAKLIQDGMRRLGFSSYSSQSSMSCIIQTFLYPNDPHFDFDEFYHKLYLRGIVLYPGKLANKDCFRIGSIGRIFPEDVQTMLMHIEDVLHEMKVELPI